MLAVSVDKSGQPILYLADCGGTIDEIQLAVDPIVKSAENQPKTQLLAFTRSTPAKGVIHFTIHTGGEGWQPSAAVPELEDGQLYVFTSYSTKYQSAGLGARLTTADLLVLRPGMVRYPKEDHLVPAATFEGSCDS